MIHGFGTLADGRLAAGAPGIDVPNPDTAEAFVFCFPAARTFLDRAVAVAVAKAAFPVWSARSLQDRANLIVAPLDALAARADAFARLMTSEQGKPLDQAMHEIMGSVFSYARLPRCACHR